MASRVTVLLKTGTAEREMQSQVLDNMELERERGMRQSPGCTNRLWAIDEEYVASTKVDTPGACHFNL